MRTLGLLGLVAAVLALTALASPWVWSAAAVMGRSFSFARVYDRVFEVLLVAGLLASWRAALPGTGRSPRARAITSG